MNKKLFKYYGILIFFTSLFILKNNISSAQTFNPYTGNYTTTYGLPFPSYGQAMASQNQLNYSQQYLEALKLRDSMIQQYGLAALEKLEREKKAPWSDFVDFSLGKPENSNAVNNYGIFKFDNSINASNIADELFRTPSNAGWKPYFIAAIEEYENLTLNSAWKNNVAGAIAVFAQIATKIYHNIEIPPGFRKEEYFNIINNRLNQ